jgi:aryl sulfotransferase
MATMGTGGLAGGVVWPVKQRELGQFVVDSRPWNDFVFRDDDVVITTWAKSGTTWMQQIVGHLLLAGDANFYGEDFSPWIEFRLREGESERAAAQTHRRYLKSHLPLDALVYSPSAKYILIGRDIRDAYWSWHNHHMSFKAERLEYISSLYPDQKPFTYPNPDTRLAFLEWLEHDSYPNWSFWDYYRTWFDARHLPNLKLIHFANLLADLPGQIEGIAEFLGVDLAPDAVHAIADHCSFANMRRLALERSGMLQTFKQGGASFFHKGTNGRWRDVLTDEDQAYLASHIARRLTPDCAHWLATGQMLH